MNRVTRDIMKLLGVSAERAIEIQEQMQIDFSQCTQREFNKCARDTLRDMTSSDEAPR